MSPPSDADAERERNAVSLAPLTQEEALRALRAVAPKDEPQGKDVAPTADRRHPGEWKRCRRSGIGSTAAS